MTTDEQDKFLQALSTHPLGAAFATQLGTGLRRGELLGLHWNDVDLEQKVLHVRRGIVYIRGEGIIEELPKTKKVRRTIPLSILVVEFLHGHQEKLAQKGIYRPDGPVFCSKEGTYIWPDNFNRSFEKLRKKLKMDHINPHALRYPNLNKIQTISRKARVLPLSC